MHNPHLPVKKPESKEKLFLVGASVGLVYGLLIRLGSQVFSGSDVFSVMTLGFLVLLPFAMGFVTIFPIARRDAQSASVRILLPWIPVLGGTLATILVYWEGMICAVLFLPISLLLASIGGLTAGFFARSRSSQITKNVTLGCILALPILVTPWEGKVFFNNEVRRVDTSIVIRATPEVVWQNIESVNEIRPSELPPSWSRKIGFPAPLEATLSYPGIGGTRHASFTGGVLFIENVDEWVPNNRLGFSIHAQTEQIPKWKLDDHVRVGGKFFDVLSGEYVIERLPDGVRLHLSSEHRLATDFNWYSRLWTDAIMNNIQTTILDVIRNRCEAATK